ncbi:hypothetical protein [Prescottella agglutinans]|uniref:Uncharacterized protein n=1 Tax=Prescottella agglutinans TaxID=1644129 RepID=A0ABT6MGL6_9NOCA|nr:hypothetical protein [Prescottella agglutinans]
MVDHTQIPGCDVVVAAVGTVAALAGQRMRAYLADHPRADAPTASQWPSRKNGDYRAEGTRYAVPLGWSQPPDAYRAVQTSRFGFALHGLVAALNESPLSRGAGR